MSDKQVRTEITASASQAIREWKGFADVVQSTSQTVTSGLSRSEAMAGRLQTSLGSLSALLAGGAFAAGIRNQLNLMDATSKSAQSAGVATEQFSSMSYAAALADVSTEALAKTYTKLNGTLIDAQQGQKEAVELFRRMKLDPQQFKDADALLLALAERFASMPDGIAKSAMAVDWFGERLGPGLVPFLNQGAEGIAALREEAARLGVVVGTEAGKAAEEFNDTLTRLNQRAQGMQQQLATAMLPTLQTMASALFDVDREGKAVEKMGQGLRVVFQAVSVLGANVNLVLGGMGREVGAILAQLGLVYDVLRAPPGELVDTAKRAWTGWSAISDAVKADGVRARAELDLFERRMLGLGGLGTRENEDRGFTPSTPGKPGFAPLPKAAAGTAGPAAGAAPTSFMQYYELMLAQEKEAAARRDALHDYSKEQELAFWRDLQANLQLTSKDQIEIMRKTSRLELDILRDKAKEAKALDDIAWAGWRDNSLARIDQETEEARQKLDLGVITQDQLIQQEMQFEQRRHAVKLLALQNSLATLDPERDPVKIAQINQQIEALEMQHQLQISTLRGRAAVEANTLQQGMASTMKQGFAGVLARIGTTVRSIGDLARGLVQVVLQSFIQMLAQMAAKWLVQQLMMKAIGKVSAAGQIIAESAKAGAGGVASMAAAPFPLNMSAPAFGAGMAALAMGYMPMAMASAAGGYDIPAGVNPMVQTHAREMILPATLSDTVRDMAAVYAGGERAGGGEPITIHGAPDDTVKVRDLARLLKAMKRDFILTKGDLR